MMSFITRTHSELLEGVNLRSTFLAMLAGFLLAFALLALSNSVAGFSSLKNVGAAPAVSVVAEGAETFDYFPSHYLNQAKAIEPQPETF